MVAIKDTLPRAVRLRYGVAAERLPEGPLREAYVGPLQLDAQVGKNPIANFETQRPNMIGNLV